MNKQPNKIGGLDYIGIVTDYELGSLWLFSLKGKTAQEWNQITNDQTIKYNSAQNCTQLMDFTKTQNICAIK